MQFSKIASSLMALAAFANAAAIATPMENMTPAERSPLDKRGGTSYFAVSGSGGARSSSGSGNSQTVSVSCGTITASNMYQGQAMYCTAQLSGSFVGCDGCIFNGDFPTFSLAVSTKCGNAHISANAQYNLDDEGQGSIGENISVHDCHNTAYGSKTTIKVCAAPNWRLVEC